jgi:hypothetical protein
MIPLSFVDQYQNLEGHDVSIFLLHPKRRQQVPLQHLYLSTKLHCPTSEKRVSLILLPWKPQILLIKFIFRASTAKSFQFCMLVIPVLEPLIWPSTAIVFKPFCPHLKIINHTCLPTQTVPVPQSNPANKCRFIKQNNIFKNLTKFRHGFPNRQSILPKPSSFLQYFGS